MKMNKDDEDVMSKIRVLREETAPQDLYDRIMTVVPHMAQLPAREQARPKLSGFLRFFGQWNYAIGVKCAAFMIVAVMGLYAGRLDVSAVGTADGSGDNAFSAIVTGDLGWEE